MPKMQTIDETIRDSIVDNIVKLISRTLKLDEISDQMLKIRQHFSIMSICLLGKEYNPNIYDEFINVCARKYMASMVNKGDSVGTKAAQSFVSPMTQTLLKAQHSAGVQKHGKEADLVALGKLKVNPRTITFHVNGDKTLEELVDMMKQHEHVTLDSLLKPIVNQSKFIPREFTPLTKGTYNQYSIYVNIPTHIKHTCVFSTDAEKMISFDVTYLDIINAIVPNKDIGMIIHPTLMRSFELCPNGIEKSKFIEKIQQLLNMTLKGIDGLISYRIISITANDIVKYQYYDGYRTYLYLDRSMIHLFPIDILLTRIVTNTGSIPELENDQRRIVCQGECTLLESTYNYIEVTTTRTVADITKLLGNTINSQYTVTNDPLEMVKIIGRIGARSTLEYSFSKQLDAGGFRVSFPHIEIISTNILSGRLFCPFTPKGVDNKGNDALFNFTQQNLTDKLITETIKAQEYNPNTLASSVIVGKKIRFGTGFVQTIPNNNAIELTREAYSEYVTKQVLMNTNIGVNFYGLGKVNRKNENISDINFLKKRKGF